MIHYGENIIGIHHIDYTINSFISDNTFLTTFGSPTFNR